MLFLLGLLLMALAVVQLFASDFSWRLHAWGQRTQGVFAERTPEWDMMRRWTGVLVLLLAFGLLIGGCVEHNRSERQASRSERHDVVPEASEMEWIGVPPDVREQLENAWREQERKRQSEGEGEGDSGIEGEGEGEGEGEER